MFRRKKQEQPTVRNPQNSGAKAPVFSYYSSRSSSADPKAGRNMAGLAAASMPKRTSWWLIYLPSLLSIFLVILSALYVTTLTSEPRINITSQNGRPAVVQDTVIYERAAEKLLTSSLFNKSKLTINTDKLAADMQKQFPELGDIVVTVPLIGRKLIIQVQPALPSLILTGQGGSYVIDDSGTAVLASSQLLSSVRDTLPVIADDSGIDIEIGKQILTTDLVAFVGELAAQLKAKQLQVQAYSLPARANELHLRLEGKGYYVKFNTEIDARLQVGTYLALIEKLNADGVTPAEYVDVRVEERSYYK
jgi:hypothetical protein